MSEGSQILDQATTVGCPTCQAMPGDKCRAADGRTAGVMIHRARVAVWRAGFSSAADELDEREAARQASEPETAQRLDDLEREVGALVERLDRLSEACTNMATILGGVIALLPDDRGPVDVGLTPRLPEDVPQSVRTGEDRPLSSHPYPPRRPI